MRRAPTAATIDQTIHDRLVARLGRVHLRQRLGLESEYERQVFHRGTHFFHFENWVAGHNLLRAGLLLMGMLARGRRNALDLRVVHNQVVIDSLPAPFDGYRVLHLSDLHLDMSADSLQTLTACVRTLDYDLCVLTGDYRYQTHGSCEPALAAMARLRSHLKKPVYAVLGNHDSIRMVPALEDLGIQVLLNESIALRRQRKSIHLAGIDDAHYFRVDNMHQAARDIPHDAVSILLSHTPETYRNAAHAGFNLMLCGHTHGGQICLPGGIPIITDADCPRRFARGAWKYERMAGYTSVGAGCSIVDVRFNCQPEVTLHWLRRGNSKRAGERKPRRRRAGTANSTVRAR